MISPDDLHNVPSLVSKLKNPTDPVSVHVSERLSIVTLQMLAQESEIGEAELHNMLAEELTELINRGALYDEVVFAEVELSPTTRELLKKNPEDKGLVLLNRALLEDSYKGEVSKHLGPYWLFM
jgi:hypothetical protein